jgi:alkyldihydroxyacetonephosphate synthase
VIIDLGRLCRIIELNEEDLTVTVEAGVKISELESWLNSRGYTLDYHPQSFHLATVGGAIAHRGTGSHSFSNIENLVLSLEVVLPSGDYLRVGPGTSVRTSMGPDLRQLFIGSEGTLGIVVKATLRIQPLANSALDRAYVFGDVKQALGFLREFTVRLPPPHRVVVHDEESSAYMLGEPRVIALVRFRRHDESLVRVEADLADSLAKASGGSSAEPSLVRQWRQVFARGYESQLLRLINSGLWMDTLDAAATWSRLPRIHGELRERLHSIDGFVGVLSRFTHPYVNGASMYSVMVFKGDRELYWRAWEEAARVVINNGGTVSHHHGVGLLKKRWLRMERSDVELLSALKRLIDDRGIMNPNKLIG